MRGCQALVTRRHSHLFKERPVWKDAGGGRGRGMGRPMFGVIIGSQCIGS